MYIIKQSGIFIGSFYHAEREFLMGSAQIMYNLAKLKCKKIARTIYFYITEHTVPIRCYFKEHFQTQPTFQALAKGSSWRLVINPHRTKEERRNRTKAKYPVKKKNTKQKQKQKLTTERIRFGLQTTPEIETKVLRHQIVKR